MSPTSTKLLVALLLPRMKRCGKHSIAGTAIAFKATMMASAMFHGSSLQCGIPSAHSFVPTSKTAIAVGTSERALVIARG